MWRGEKRARECSICSGQELELELELKRWGLLSANEMAACLHQQPPAMASASAAASTSAFYSNSMNIWRGEKQREQSNNNNNNNIHMKSNKIKRNETKPNKMKLLPRRHLALHTKIFFHWKHLPGKSCLNLATRTHVCAVGVGTGRGRVGVPEEKPYWKTLLAPQHLTSAFSLGLSSFFGHATQLQMILPTPMLTQRHQVQWSAAAGSKGGGRRRAQRKPRQKQEEVWQQKC